MPPSAGRLSKRLVKNIDYFQVDPEINNKHVKLLIAWQSYLLNSHEIFFVSISPNPLHFCPPTLPDRYLQSNYVLVFLILVLYCLISSPLLLIVIAGAGGAAYFASVKNETRKIAIAGRQIINQVKNEGIHCLHFQVMK